jgi:hypothetical protein
VVQDGQFSMQPGSVSGKMSTHLDAVPVLAGEGVLGLLLETLLALGQSLVPAARVSAIESPPDARLLLEIVQSVQKSIIRGGRNVLANSHLDEHYANRGTDVLLGLVMETVESSREIWGFLRSSRNCDFVVWALPACGKTRDVGQLLKRCDWSIGA